MGAKLQPQAAPEAGPMIRILLADDHEVVRFGLTALIDAEPDLETVGAATDGLEAVGLAVRLRPDVVLMDLSMPVLDGVTAIRAIRAAVPGTRVLVLTSFAQAAVVREALEAGAGGYLVKDCDSATLVQGIRDLHRGGTPLSVAARRIAYE